MGYLGEKSQFSWWPTGFFEPASKMFLEPVFTKTLKVAQYHGVLAAASRVHDEHLNVGCYHLFRWPEEIEQDLYHLLMHEEMAPFYQHTFQTKDAARNTLSEYALTSAKPTEGPIKLGLVSELESPETVSKLARIYLSAFDHQMQSFPYFVS